MGATPTGVKLWLGGIVPYEINADLGNIVAIKDAIKTLEQQTNVRLVGRYLQNDYVRFSKQTLGNPNSKLGRKGGRQFVNASLNDVGSIVHEICHALGMMHEHCRSDRDSYVIFHADRVTDDMDQYEKDDTSNKTEKYDYESLMHYSAGDPSNPIFESVTGLPAPGDIGSKGSLTITDKTLLEAIYPAAPVIRRTDGEGGAGAVLQTSAIAVMSVNNTAIVANAISNAAGKYQLVLWRIRDNGVVLRMPDPVGATGGKATDVQIVAVGRLFVSAMKNAAGKLLLISHGNNFDRLHDSAGLAGEASDVHIVAIANDRVITPCISGSDRVLSIVWQVRPDGSIERFFDSGTDGPKAKRVTSVVIQDDGSIQIVGILYTTPASKLVLSTWKVDAGSITKLADSGNVMGKADFAQAVKTDTGHVVVVCRDASSKLLLIPFKVADDGAPITRLSGLEGHAGKIREVSAAPRPYGLLTAVISDKGQILLIKWGINADGALERLGDSGDQAGQGSQLSVTALPFAAQATVCTAARDGSAKLLPITWDDVDGPGELDVV
jgi:hypothetical protein